MFHTTDGLDLNQMDYAGRVFGGRYVGNLPSIASQEAIYCRVNGERICGVLMLPLRNQLKRESDPVNNR